MKNNSRLEQVKNRLIIIEKGILTSDGRIVAFSWTYNSETNKYLNIQRLISMDNGFT